MSDLEAVDLNEAGDEETTSLEEGKLLDYITNEPVKDTPKEQVRQRIARAFFHEYGISADDMVRDFKLKIDGRRKSIDIAIFEPGKDKTLANLRRVQR
jgi:type I restriction enzyme M protein